MTRFILPVTQLIIAMTQLIWPMTKLSLPVTPAHALPVGHKASCSPCQLFEEFHVSRLPVRTVSLPDLKQEGGTITYNI